jgi:ankyrin repeat protein
VAAGHGHGEVVRLLLDEAGRAAYEAAYGESLAAAAAAHLAKHQPEQRQRHLKHRPPQAVPESVVVDSLSPGNGASSAATALSSMTRSIASSPGHSVASERGDGGGGGLASGVGLQPTKNEQTLWRQRASEQAHAASEQALAALCDVGDDQGLTPLHEAARRGDGATVGLLLAAGASVTARSRGCRRTAAEVALEARHHGVAALIRAHAAAAGKVDWLPGSLKCLCED